MRQERAIPKELQDRADRELEGGERVLWIAMPVPRFFTPLATGTFLFGLPWTAFAIFWTAGAAFATRSSGGAGPPWPFALFGVPFILVGFAMLSSPIWAYRKALTTVYVITDKRAMTFEGGWSTTIRSYPPDRLQEICRRERRDGTGDVLIARRAWRDSDGDRQSEELGFLRIGDPKEVERMLKELAEQDAAGNAGQ